MEHNGCGLSMKYGEGRGNGQTSQLQWFRFFMKSKSISSRDSSEAEKNA